VRRNVNGVETWAVYGIGGELLAEYAATIPSVASPQKEYGYRNGQLLVTAARTNVAASANGATATAQNYTQDGVYPGMHFQPAYAIDGVRHTSTSGDQYWRDEHGLSSWIQIDFGGSKSIDEVDVITMADVYWTQADPSATQTFANYGTTGFDVQYWTGSAWQTVTGGSVSGNNLVWKKINFTAINTSKIRVVANSAVDGVVRLVEVEAYATDVRWLVTDQLATPRMIFDKTGALATTSRHDYLPFGEELFASTGLRTTSQGYTAAGSNPVDKARQKFTLQERDNETGLDYMHARYFASAQGRFSSADSVAGSIGNPQSLNRYAYVNNNPLNFTDPTGHDRFSASSNGFGETMGQGGYMDPDNVDPTGLAHHAQLQIDAWIAQEAAEQQANSGSTASGSAVHEAGHTLTLSGAADGLEPQNPKQPTEEQRRCDQTLASIFGDPDAGAVAAGSGFEPKDLPGVGGSFRGSPNGHLNNAMHLYGSEDGFSEGSAYIPAGGKYIGKNPYSSEDSYMFYYAKLGNVRGVTLFASHISDFTSPRGRTTGKTQIGNIGGEGGRSVAPVGLQNPNDPSRGTYIHAHYAIHKGYGYTGKRLSFFNTFCK
jgi:RHS repeat-associated protein